MNAPYDNVGTMDAALRVLAALGLFGLALGGVGVADADYLLMLLVPPLLLVAYLLLTSFVRVDPVYAALGLDSAHHVERRRRVARKGKPAPA